MQPFNSECYGSPNLASFCSCCFCLWRSHVCFRHSVSSCAYAASSIQKIWVCFLLLGRATPLEKDNNFPADASVSFFLLLLSGCGSLMKVLRLFPGLKELDDAQNTECYEYSFTLVLFKVLCVWHYAEHMNKINCKAIILYILNINNPVNNSAVYILLYFHILFVVGENMWAKQQNFKHLQRSIILPTTFSQQGLLSKHSKSCPCGLIRGICSVSVN